VQRVMDLCVKHLTQSKEFDAAKKLRLADQYRLDSVRDHCLQSLATLLKLIKLKSEADNFSDDMKIAICDRLLSLKPNMRPLTALQEFEKLKVFSSTFQTHMTPFAL
ncbi:hypothetical protein PENTCL1PPCAC_24189, partial [Pristionchus entomophagus]